MNAPQRLLAATDLSAPARHAVERAALVARTTGAKLDLVHVAGFSRIDELRRLVPGVPADVEARMREQTQIIVDALAAMVRERHGVDAATHVSSGPLLAAIDGAASAVDADLLVLGARGSSMVRHFVLGTTAARLIDTSTRPLLVVKRPVLAAYRSVLVAVDFSRASLPAVQLARAVAPQARLVLLHAYEAPFEGKLRIAGVDDRYLQDYRDQALAEARGHMATLCERAGLPPQGSFQVFAHGPATRSILEHEDDEDTDLIVVGRQGRSRIEDMLLGSVSRRVLAEAEADVLVLP